MIKTLIPPCFALFVFLSGGCCTTRDKPGCDKRGRLVIKIRHVCKLENPRPDKQGGGNSCVLEGMPEDGPNISASFARGYDDCTQGFFNADLELVGSWREPVAGGDMVMNVAAGDLDEDGHNEVALVTRSRASGVHVLRWDARARKLKKVWSFLETPTVRTEAFFRGLAVGDFTAHEGREVCFGGDGTGLYLLDQHGQLIAHDRTIGKTIQRIDICDHDKDGYDELIISTGRRPGEVYYARWQPKAHTLQVVWSANVTPEGLGGDNCYEALYHPKGHPGGGPAIAVSTERETREVRAGSLLLLDMSGKELWRYVYNTQEERGGACGFSDITGDGVPEIFSRYHRILQEPHERGVLVLDNRGRKLTKVPGVSASSAGPYVFRPNGPGTKPIYLVATSNIYEIECEDRGGDE